MNFRLGNEKEIFSFNLTRFLFFTTLILLLIANLSGNTIKSISFLAQATYLSGLFMLISMNLITIKSSTKISYGYYKLLFLFGIAAKSAAGFIALIFDYLNPSYEMVIQFFLNSTFYNLMIITIGFIVYLNYNREITSQNKIMTPEIKTKNDLPQKISSLLRPSSCPNLYFLLIIILFFVTRLYATDFINGSDNYNVLGIKNLYENGISYYKYSPITDQLMLWSVQLFGFNFFAIKVPFILYSLVTLIFLYLTAAMISKPLALLSAFLYTISPWAIIQSNITRDYSFDLMIFTVVIYFCFLIYKKAVTTEHIFQSFIAALSLCLPLIVIYYIYENIRVQTLVAVFFLVVIGVALLYRIINKKPNLPAYVKIAYWPLTIGPVIIISFLVQRFPFEKGFYHPDTNFIKVFFDSGVYSPWQWFHASGFHYLLIIFIFIMGLALVNKKQSYKQDLLLILFLSFFYGIIFYSFKFTSHLDYIPVRYVYFLFTPYVILLANGILNILKPFNRIPKYVIIASLLLFVNYQALIYSINPKLAYEKEGVTTLAIDNINIGRFHLLEVVNYLENELNVSDNSILVFDDRYEEFILFLDRPMDKNRYLLRPSNNMRYDIAQNTYVQSIYFGYSELFQAINHKSGIYITSSPIIHDPLKVKNYPLDKNNFKVNDVDLEYLTTVNGFKIYTW